MGRAGCGLLRLDGDMLNLIPPVGKTRTCRGLDMSLDINEIRSDDYQTIDKLLTGSDSTHDETNNATARYRSVLSLVARDEGQIVGAILCYKEAEQDYFYQIKIADPSQYPDLAKALVDKALRKLIGFQRVHSCRIRLLDTTEQRPFWEMVKWDGHPELKAQPVSSSAVVDRLGQWEATSPPPFSDSPPESEETVEDEAPVDLPPHAPQPDDVEGR